MVSLASFQSSSLQHDFLGGEIMVPFQVKYTLDINVVEKLDGCGRAYCDILLFFHKTILHKYIKNTF